MEIEGLRELVSKISLLVVEGDNLAKQLCIIESLRFPAITERQSRIGNAHPRTFDWIFEDNEVGNASSEQQSILRWLNDGSGVYWVSGKAGFGKTTFMKFLYEHRSTVANLRLWAGEKKLLIAGFFFWRTGIYMQKIQLGLLQTLLYPVLRQISKPVASVCSSQWYGNSVDNLWTHAELMNAFAALFKCAIDSVKFCSFIDGLDEYEGDHTEVINILDEFASSNDIKICVSSRPYNVFENAYGRDKRKTMKLEDLTRPNIPRFATETLAHD